MISSCLKSFKGTRGVSDPHNSLNGCGHPKCKSCHNLENAKTTFTSCVSNREYNIINHTGKDITCCYPFLYVYIYIHLYFRIMCIYNIYSSPLIYNRTYMWCPLLACTCGPRHLRRFTLLHWPWNKRPGTWMDYILWIYVYVYICVCIYIFFLIL